MLVRNLSLTDTPLQLYMWHLKMWITKDTYILRDVALKIINMASDRNLCSEAKTKIRRWVKWKP